MSYELSIFGPSDKEAFVEAFAADSEPVDRDAQARRLWWCFDNPSGGAFGVVRAGSEIAATSYLGGKRLVIRGVTMGAYEIGETATRPAHQRRGLFSQLVNASRAHAIASGRPLIYGTPNGQSTPGYAKLGFDIVQSQQSWLFLIPNLRYLLPIPRWRHPVRELTCDEYIDQTVAFDRLNVGAAAYLAWRFRDAPMLYRFFSLELRGMTWHVAFRTGVLGRYPTLVCAEYFRDGIRPPVTEAAFLVHRAASFGYSSRTHVAVQIHGAYPEGRSSTSLRLHGLFPHRVLPVCAVESDCAGAEDWFSRFQLSDCDIG